MRPNLVVYLKHKVLVPEQLIVSVVKEDLEVPHKGRLALAQVNASLDEQPFIRGVIYSRERKELRGGVISSRQHG